jgi:hypothetical protein
MDSKIKQPSTPEEAITMLNRLPKDKIVGELGRNGSPNYNNSIELDSTPVARAPIEVPIDGFLTQIANDVFTNTHDHDVADRTDALVYLLGEKLYNEINYQSRSCGLVNEASFLRQRIAIEVKGQAAEQSMDKVIAGGLALPKRTKDDDDPQSADNQDIRDYLGDTVLGAVRGIAKQYGTSNIAALRIITRGCLIEKVKPKETPRLKRRRNHEKAVVIDE